MQNFYYIDYKDKYSFNRFNFLFLIFQKTAKSVNAISLLLCLFWAVASGAKLEKNAIGKKMRINVR